MKRVCLLISMTLAVGSAQAQDIEVGHFEITQGLQDGNNSIPLVLGKPVVIRVFPRTSAGEVRGIDARLRAFRQGRELSGSPIAPDNGPVAADDRVNRGDPNDSLNFTLELDWYAKDTGFRAELILPTNVVDKNPDNNLYPPAVDAPFQADYQDREAYSIQFVRVHYTNPAWTGAARPTDRVSQQMACDFLRSIFPVDPEEMTYNPFSPAEITFGKGSTNGDLDGDALISVLNMQWRTTAAADRPDKLYAWTPENSFRSNGLSDPFWGGGQNRVALGNDTDGRWRRTFAHEIGHNTNNFGLFHTRERLKGAEFGFDVLRVDPFDRIVMRRYPPGDEAKNLFDVMRGGEVEAHAWITPRHYMDLFNHFASVTDTTASDGGPASTTGPGTTDVGDGNAGPEAADDELRELLVVRGRVHRDGGGEFFPFYRIPASGHVKTTVPTEGTHEIRFLDATGGVIQRIAWTPDFRTGDTTDEAVESRSFTWFIKPLDNVTKVELRNKRIIATLRVRPQGPRIGQLNRARLENADVEAYALTWEASALEDADESKLTHQIFYSNNQGESWKLVATGLRESRSTVRLDSLPGGKNCLFQIRTTDGFNVDVKTGEPFEVEPKPPHVTIVAPRTDREYREGAGVLLIGQAHDLEDRRLPKGNLTWKSDRQGELGSGQKLVVRKLVVGVHRITLSAQDESGATSESAPITVTITRRQ